MDHTRAATFLLADGVLPGNVERSYVCRRLIRRAALSAHTLGVRGPSLAEIARAFIPTYRGAYPELAREEQRILAELTREEQRFERTLTRGLREFERVEAETRGARRNRVEWRGCVSPLGHVRLPGGVDGGAGARAWAGR